MKMSDRPALVEEGDPCYCKDCYGRFEWNQEICYCGTCIPPCANCENAWLECDECGEVADGD